VLSDCSCSILILQVLQYPVSGVHCLPPHGVTPSAVEHLVAQRLSTFSWKVCRARSTTKKSVASGFLTSAAILLLQSISRRQQFSKYMVFEVTREGILNTEAIMPNYFYDNQVSCTRLIKQIHHLMLPLSTQEKREYDLSNMLLVLSFKKPRK